MKYSMTALVACLASSALSMTPQMNQKDVQMMHAMKLMQPQQFNQKDMQTYNAIMTNWEKYTTGQSNNYNQKDVAAFIASHPEHLTRRAEAMYAAGQASEMKQMHTRDNAYMDGTLYPLRKRTVANGHTVRLDARHEAALDRFNALVARGTANWYEHLSERELADITDMVVDVAKQQQKREVAFGQKNAMHTRENHRVASREHMTHKEE